MPREKPLYRENLDRLDEKFPDKEALAYAEIAAFFGYSLRTANRQWSPYYKKICRGVPKTAIARAMCTD